MANEHLVAVGKILSYQVLIVILTAVAFAVVEGWQKALSSILGGMAAFIPNLYFSIRVYRSAKLQAKKIVNSFYAAETGKLLLTAVIFFMIFRLPNVEIVPLLTSYAAALSIFWFALLMR